MKRLLAKLRIDYPAFQFEAGESFQWADTSQTIQYSANHPHAPALLLHELAHACLKHKKFVFDVELVRKESEAWHYAATVLAPRYGLSIDEDIREDAMDSYREWLHTRSLCPTCQMNALQTETGTYACEGCGCQWRANQARMCELRRYRLETTT